MVEVEAEESPAPNGYIRALTGAAFEEALLISAFDIAHGYVNDVDGLQRSFDDSVYGRIPLLIIDSGWYEATPWSDVAFPYQEGDKNLSWTKKAFVATVDALDGKFQGALVSFDMHAAYDAQIESAQEFFATHDRCLSVIMLKPKTKGSAHVFRNLTPHASDLRAFDVVGVTEKELGRSILDRMMALSELRRIMDASGVDAPIHVFGALDPLLAPLYFAVGGEIFDGLSWLRFAYRHEIAINREASAILDKQVDRSLSLTAFTVASQNLLAIRALSRQMKMFHARQEWGLYQNADSLAHAYDTFLSEVNTRHGR